MPCYSGHSLIYSLKCAQIATWVPYEKNDVKIQYFEILSGLLAQYEAQEISAATLQPKLSQLLEQLRICDQTDFDANIKDIQPIAYKVIAMFESGRYSQEDLTKMTFVTIDTLKRLDTLFASYNSMIFVSPIDTFFLLKIVKFALSLTKPLINSQNTEAAKVILAILCELILPFYRANLFTVLPHKGGKGDKSASNLEPGLLDIRDIGVLALQQYAIILCEHQNFDQARATLLSVDTWCSQDQASNAAANQQIKAIYNDQAATMKRLFKANRESWKLIFKNIKLITDGLKPQISISMRYYLWGRLAAEGVNADLHLATCYFELSAKHYLQMKSHNLPDRLILELKALAKRFEQVECFSCAMQCYRTAQDLYAKYTLRTDTSRIESRQLERDLKQLEITAFLYLKRMWGAIAVEPLNGVQDIVFDETKRWCQITYSDRAYMLCHAKYLNKLGVEKNVQREPCIITMNTPYELSAKTLLQSFQQARREVTWQAQHHQRRPSAPTPLKRLIEDETDVSIDSSTSFDDTLFYQIACRTLRKAPKLVRSKPSLPAKTPAGKILTTPSWGEEYPSYHPTKGVVYPIPNPMITNSSMPKDIFYAYLDRLQLSEVPDELLEKFESQLARGKIVSKGDAQGLRSITGELSDDSTYLFKINIHGEDVRLYGRKVATTLSPEGKATVLIAFDQAIRHDEQLQIEPAVSNLSL
jgi:hypothetical protein